MDRLETLGEFKENLNVFSRRTVSPDVALPLSISEATLFLGLIDDWSKIDQSTEVRSRRFSSL
jgi:hypothetical protein